MATQPDPETEIVEDEAQRREGMLTIGEHLVEARQRVTVTALTIVLTTVVTLIFTNQILDFLLEPARDADPNFRPIFTELLGFVSAYFKIGLLIGIAAAMPMLIYQGFMFINPGLEPHERRWLLPIVLLATASFAGGGAFAFFIAWPPALDFLLDFGDNIAEPQIRISNYIDMLTRFVFWTGVVFETPLVLMGLGWMGLVTARKLIKAWRWAIIGSFVVAAFITPSIDPVTQAFVAVPLIFLYGLGIILVKIVEKRGLGKDRDQDEAPEA
ncbi:MAG: sec-independent protein translocase protein TatC [Chloroflexi bacterium]|nr:MAG: sec-independent protein translocase protein TatC [Chloroflexota bacterium]